MGSKATIFQTLALSSCYFALDSRAAVSFPARTDTFHITVVHSNDPKNYGTSITR